jgi:uncharacterized cupredoxin-like copper-binding protein
MNFRVFSVTAALAMCTPAPGWAHGTAHAGAKAGPVFEQMAWGIGGHDRAVRRTIEIRMTDTMRFTPDRITVRQGETVRLVVRNNGKMLHEIVIGTQETLDGHAALMQKFPDMEHDEPYMTHVNPGQTERIVWNFNRPGQFHFACLIPGHYQAGMVGTIDVSAAAGATRRKSKA